jgi:chorismate mutase / prephenate dehydratase
MRLPRESLMANGTPQSSSLDSLRREIDAIDDRMHDLLIRRAEVVEAIAALKQADNVAPFRPGREAQILRRLVGQHRGSFPRPALVRIWREILGGTVAMQTELTVAVCDGCDFLARYHFGSYAPMLGPLPADEVIEAVAEGRATVGVVPLPEDGDDQSWWLALAAEGDPRPHVIARIPFGTVGNADADSCMEAFVIAAMAPEPSGDDCTLLGISAAEALKCSDLTDAFLHESIDCSPIAAVERDGSAAFLVEVDALLAPEDATLARALKTLGVGVQSVWLGAYARPLPDASLDGVAPE